VFDCDFQDALLILISLNKQETWYFLSKFCKQIWGVERVAFLWSALGGTLPRYATAQTCTVWCTKLQKHF